MPGIRFDNKNKINEIVDTSNRLKYILKFTYQISLDDIVYIQVDGDNFEVDISTQADMFSFKTQGLENVIIKNPDNGILQSTFDPALAQGIYNIINEYV